LALTCLPISARWIVIASLLTQGMTMAAPAARAGQIAPKR